MRDFNKKTLREQYNYCIDKATKEIMDNNIKIGCGWLLTAGSDRYKPYWNNNYRGRSKANV